MEQMERIVWHTATVPETSRALAVKIEEGLSDEAAVHRQVQYGPNELQERGKVSWLRLLWVQFTNTMVLILIAAAMVSAILGKAHETSAIAAIVILFALLGFVQEYRAEQAMAALKRLAVPLVRVRRQGEVRELSAKALVPGDVVLLESGSAVPADLRLVECVNLRIQEAALTGESEPVEKHADPPAHAESALGDRHNMAYMGTVVTYGRGTAVVTATGMETELGKIATLLQTVESGLTPLQHSLDRVGKQLAGGGGIVAALVMGIGLLRGETVADGHFHGTGFHADGTGPGLALETNFAMVAGVFVQPPAAGAGGVNGRSPAHRGLRPFPGPLLPGYPTQRPGALPLRGVRRGSAFADRVGESVAATPWEHVNGYPA